MGKAAKRARKQSRDMMMETAMRDGVPPVLAAMAAQWQQRCPLRPNPHLPPKTGRCIESTRFGLEVLGVLDAGVTAKPLPCGLQVLNPEAARLVESGRLDVSDWPKSAHVGQVLSTGSIFGGGWRCHLVIEWFEEDGGTGVLDLDLARYSKPAKDLNLLPRPFRRVVHSDDQVTGSFSGGAEAVWLDAREVDNFQDSINWSEQPDHNAVVRFATQVAKVAGLSGPQLTLAA